LAAGPALVFGRPLFFGVDFCVVVFIFFSVSSLAWANTSSLVLDKWLPKNHDEKMN
jgi:hypothetical protein